MKERKKSLNKLLKRALIVALCLVMALGTTVTIMAASFNGDLDGDGKITAYDAQLLAEYQAGNRDLDPATVIGLTIRGILDRVLGKIVDEPVEEPSESTVIEETFEVKIDENNLVTEEQVITVDNVTVTVPVGVKVDSAVLILTVQQKDTEDGSVNLEEGQEQLPLDIHIEGISEENTVPVIITISGALEAGLNQGNLALYHVENGEAVAMTQVMTAEELTAHNQFYYDPATGDVTIATVSFSVFRIVSENAKKWEGNVDHSWYFGKSSPYTIANADQLWSFSQIVGGMTQNAEGNWLDADGNVIPDKSADPHQDSFEGKVVNLAVDINLDDLDSEDGRVFYPIGYYNSEGTYKKSGVAITSGFYTFRGTFDGQGHTIANFYHNTWEMKGDHNWYAAEDQHYRDGMGLFGKVYGGTVKNLTVENFSSDGEIATTGTIAAYADCGATFENISIFNCNPRVYNIGNGGIVGCVGWYANDEHDEPVTFKNITVDNTNKISALWGSWDVACGGLVGQYYPTSGQSNAIDNAGIHMENCHVAAQIDVYNDVCANYQYYAYRYAGMLIGSIRENVTGEDGHVYPKMDGITANGCTVHFGDWNDYYYCELVANSLASYTHDHQMSRLEQVASVDVANKKVTSLAGVTTDIPASGRVNYVVVKAKDDKGMWIHGDGHEYAECYHFVNGVQHFHDVADTDNPNPTETVNGVEGVLKEDKQCIYRIFEQLCTGYGWGVTSKGIGDLTGVTVLDKIDNAESIQKFEATNKTTVENGIAISLGKLFTAVDQTAFPIFTNALNISVTDLNGEDGVNTTVELIKTGDSWEDYQVIFHGVDEVQLAIQDYYYCAPTYIKLNVEAHVHCLCGKTTAVNTTCGSCGSVASIYEPTATMPATDATGHYYLTGNSVQTEIAEYGENVSICLNGKTVDLQNKHSRCFNVINGATVNLTDCDGSDATGIITGSTHATIYIHANSRLNMYNGKLTGNKNSLVGGSGIVSLQAAAEGVNRAAFYMYGGQITGNEMRTRGAVFTQIPNENLPKAGEIHILGGQITGNTSYAERAMAPYDQTNAVSGGAGIYSFGPVYVGGDAVIADNTCTMATSTRNENILLRTAYENALYSGQLIIEQALTGNEKINYGTWKKDNSDDLQSISVDASLITEDYVAGVLYEGNDINYDATENRFFTLHIHCLCGNDTVMDNVVCASCGSDAVVWTGENRVPEGTATGYFYLQQDVTTGGDINSSAEMHLCLNGHKVDFAGEGQWNINPNNTVSVSDCMAVEAYSDAYSAGQITGLNGRNDQGKLLAGIKIMTGATFKLYDGMVTGNNNSDGTIWLIASSDANATSKFYMYGGQLSNNTVGRGTVFTQVNTNGLYAGEIYILGGTITGNHGTDTSNGGGAGIYAFGSVTVGGDAKIIDNTADQQGVSANMVLRNDYSGKLVISSEMPLQTGAQIDCSTYVADDKANLSIIGEPAEWDAGWIKYNGDYVQYDPDTKVFFQGHTHCLCGKTRTGTCSECGSTAVEWTAWEETDALPTTTGNYYLVNDVTVVYAAEKEQKATVIGSQQNVAIDLCGHNILNENGDRLAYLWSNATLTVTDCTEDAGQISGFGSGSSNNAAIMLQDGSTFNLYNGKITQNSGGNNGIVLIRERCAFNMYGGEISNNESLQRAAIFGYYTSEDVTAGTAPVIRILGGKVTGNSSTTTDAIRSGGGIFSLGPVYVGGDAVIADNTANTTNNPNILLAAGKYFGKLILDSEKPLTANASVDYGVRGISNFQSTYISFSETAYDLPVGVLTYNEQTVVYTDGAFALANDGGEGEAEAEPAE